jgi:hypothetical protein
VQPATLDQVIRWPVFVLGKEGVERRHQYTNIKSF